MEIESVKTAEGCVCVDVEHVDGAHQLRWVTEAAATGHQLLLDVYAQH